MALIDVITYAGDSSTLIFRYPHTEFNTMSQLIVHESQEAVFFKDGQMLDTFGPGKYTLNTGNIPLLSKLINLSTGGESPFKCEIYFINKSLALNYKWGTTSKTRVMDNRFHLLLEIGASGTLGLKVTDPRKLLSKIVGTKTELTAEACLNYFRENVSAKVKEYLARVMRQPEMDFLVLDMYLSNFSEAVKAKLQYVFQDVGVDLYNFVIGTINIPDEQYEVIMQGQQKVQRGQYERQLKKIEAEGDAESDVIRAGGRAKSRSLEGYNWADEQVAEITKLYASNVGSGQNPVNMLAQAPMAIAFGNMLQENMQAFKRTQFSNPPVNFGGDSDSSRGLKQDQLDDLDYDFNAEVFGNDFPNPDTDRKKGDMMKHDSDLVKNDEKTVNQSYEDPVETLSKLKKMLDLKLIPQKVYDEKMKEILDRM